MAFGMLDAIIGGAGVISNFIGKKESNEIAQQGVNTAAAAQEAQNRISERVLEALFATSIDPQGNRTAYDPETNTFTSTPAPLTQQIIDAGQTEELRSITEDAGRSRMLREDAFGQKGTANQLLSSLFQQMGEPSGFDPSTIENAMREKARLSTNEAFSDQTSQILRQLTRSGGLSNAGDILGGIGGQQAKQLRMGDLDAAIQAPQLSEALETQRANRLGTTALNLGNFAGSFSPVQPSNIADVLANRVGTMKAIIPQGAGSVMAGNQKAANALAESQQFLSNPGFRDTETLPGIAAVIAGLGRSKDRTDKGNTTEGKSVPAGRSSSAFGDRSINLF